MNVQDRQVYVELYRELDSPICCICDNAEGCGGCDDGFYCVHPDIEKEGFPGNREEQIVETGQDCYGFNTSYSIDDIAEVTGFILANNLDEWSWYKKKNGQLVVKGNFSPEVLKELAIK